MIDLEVFEQEFSVLLDRFNYPASHPVLRRYYECLSAQLTTEQFVEAAKRVFIEDDFFPSPKRIVEKVKEGLGETALNEWNALMESIARNERCELSASGGFALKSIGGLQTVGFANSHSELPRLRKEFIAVYQQVAAKSVTYPTIQISTPQLPQAILEDDEDADAAA